MASINSRLATILSGSSSIVPSVIFADSLNRFLADDNDPKTKKILGKLELVIEYRGKIPPKKLPNGLKDHKLDPPPDCWECHLEGDILLLYNFFGRKINLIYVCTHDELYRSGTPRMVQKYIN